MTAVSATPTRKPLLRRLLDGSYTWGDLEISDGRYGVSRYRLVVYPPGLSRDQRIPLRLLRTFPMWGLAVWVTLQVIVMAAMSPGVALAISTTATLLAFAAAFVMSGPARGAVRSLTVVRMTGVHDNDILVKHVEFRTLATQLLTADARLAEGAINPVEHEAEVWRVYDRLAS